MIDRRHLERSLWLGALLGLIFGGINIVFSWMSPLSDDTIGALLRFYGPMFGAWAWVGFRSARRDGRVWPGVMTASVVAFATFFVFALMNLLRVNLFLDELTGRADWRNMMATFRASQFENLRAFIVAEYVKGLPLKVGVASSIGALLGLLGGSLARVLSRGPIVADR